MLILCGIPIFPLMDGDLPENLWKFKGIIIMKKIYQTRFYCLAVSHMQLHAQFPVAGQAARPSPDGYHSSHRRGHFQSHLCHG